MLFSYPLQLNIPSPTLPYTLQNCHCRRSLPDGRRRRKTFRLGTILEPEYLALIWIMRRYRPLSERRHLLVKTNLQALTWLHRFIDVIAVDKNITLKSFKDLAWRTIYQISCHYIWDRQHIVSLGTTSICTTATRHNTFIAQPLPPMARES